MQERSKRRGNGGWADLLMVLLCAATSFWLFASPLVPYAFHDTAAGLTEFLIATVVLTVILGSVGVRLNHLAARNARVTLRRGRRR